MPRVVFVAPYAMETTLRFVRAAVSLPGVHLGLVSQEPKERLPKDLVKRLSSFHRVQNALSPDALEKAARKMAGEWGGGVDCLVGVLEQLQEPLAEVRERLEIRGMDLEEAHNFRDKARMKSLLREHGLPCARHRLAATAKEALAFADECLPLVAKPPSGAGAQNTLRIDTREQLAGYLRTAPPTAAKPLLLEEFILGKEHSFDSVSLRGRHLFHSISVYHPTPLEVMEKPWVQWCVVLPRHIAGDEYDDIYAAGKRTLDALGMVTGLTHMEWFRRPDGSLAISEVAARPPGAQFTSLISFAHDFDFYEAWARLAILEEFEAPTRDFAVGALFLRGQGEGQVAHVEGIEEAQRELGDLIVQAKIPRPGQKKAPSYEGEGFLILRHPETEAVEAGLRRLLQLVHIELG